MKFEIAEDILFKPGDEQRFNLMFGTPVGAGLAVSKEEMQTYIKGLKNLDFRVSRYSDDLVQVWVNQNEYLEYEKKLHDRLSKEQTKIFLKSLPGTMVRSLIQAFFSASMIAGLVWVVNQLFGKALSIGTFFGWAFGAAFVVTAFILMVFTDTSKKR